MNRAWLLVVALLVVSATSNGLEKRQVFDLSTRLAPSNELILQCEGQDVVFLTGNNARTVSLPPGARLERVDTSLIIIVTDIIVDTIPDINMYTAKECNPPSLELVIGPGTIYASDGQAFYINDGCTFETNFITQAINNAPDLAANFEVMSMLDGGDTVNNLIVNSGEFEITITGATPMMLGPADFLRYSGGTLTTLTGVVRSGITEFATFARGSDGRAQFNIFNATQSTVVQGPGQVFIGADKAIFIGDLGSGVTPPFENINREVVTNTFEFMPGTGTMTVVSVQAQPITVLSSETATFEINGPSTASFTAEMQLTFTTTGGQVSNFGGITQFSVFDNNEVTISTMPTTSSHSAGGTVFIDSVEGTAVFTTDANPQAQQVFQMFIPDRGDASYRIDTDNEGVRTLVRITGSPPDTTEETIQTITGSYVMSVDSSETVTYSDSEIQIRTFTGIPRIRIGEVTQLLTNTDTNPAGTFVTSSAAPFQGSGTVSYSRGTGFYTTDSDLGDDIGFPSSTAPIPDIDFEVTPIGLNEVDGVNYTVNMVTQTIGGDRVINFEATSYTTTPDQEILYADDTVTVIRPMFTGSGNVTYDGATEMVTYNDRNGNPRTLEGVQIFNQFSGGDITTIISSPVVINAQGPGKLYVSSDLSTVTFSTSDIITPEIAALIRDTIPDIVVAADQFSSIYNGVFKISTGSATITYLGEGVIWSSQFNNTDYAFYVDDEQVSSKIEETVSSLLETTKSEPVKDSGILRLIFNGREIFEYSPVGGSREIRILPSESFDYANMTISGRFPSGTGYSMITVFDGVEVRQVNSAPTNQMFEGPGLLLLPQDSDKAFYTTNSATVNYLTASIAILRRFLVPPRIRPGDDRLTTKNREIIVDFGSDVSVYQGADITFECKVSGGRPTPTVEFYRVLPNGDSIMLNDTMGGKIIVGENSLTLTSVQMIDEGEYICVASNGVPPPATASSTLRTVKAPVAPVLQPGWFPFRPTSGQKLIFPPAMETINLREFKTLVVPCRFDGRPKAEITWQFNDNPIADELPFNSFLELEPVQGRGVLILDLENSFNATFNNPLLGTNIIDCIGDNDAGTDSGRLILQGEIIDCGTLAGVGCSTTCGFGIRNVNFECLKFDGVDPEPEPADISEVPLSIIPLIERTEVCNTPDNGNIVICPVIEYRWNVSDWSECSRTCNGGLRTRNVSCYEEKFSINSRYVAQVDSTELTLLENTTMCLMSEKAGPRPIDQEACQTQSCPFYKVSAFGKCSATCGGGVRQRTVRCVVLENRYKDMNGITQLNVTDVNITQCGGAPPSETELCNTFDCFYRWVPGTFGQCGNTSLLGPPVSNEFSCKERPVYCVDDRNVQVNDSFCDSNIKPSTLASCGHKNCFVGRWENTFFSQCSETCGYGVQTRELVCLSPETNTQVPIDFCDVSTRPIIERPCFVRNCENMCLRDENPVVCSVLANMDLCNSPYAMANNGTRCCASCGTGMPGTGTD